MRAKRTIRLMALSAALFMVASGATAQVGENTGSSIGSVDPSDTIILRGNVAPLARPEFDIGPAQASLPMHHIILTLRLSPQKQAALDGLLAAQQDPSSPEFHQWLTPEEYGARFGPSDDDLSAVEDWLRSEGFAIDEVARGRMWINFSGTAAQVEHAFRTRMDDFAVNGVVRHANATNPSIPRALSGLVAGVVSLNSFPLRALHTQPQLVSGQGIAPSYTYGSSHYLAPADFATIYNMSPLYTAGINGAGTTIAIVGRTHPSTALTDWNGFRSSFGLPYNPPNIIVNGADPGDQGSGEDGEAALDVEWSGAVAPGAAIDFVCSASTASTDGVDLSAQYIVDTNLAPVMSTSFGLCEADLGAGGNAFYSTLWAQAAAQGITAFVSSGDNGVAGCDSASASSGTGQAVNGLASTPYNTAVGGTQFMDAASPSSYWSSNNDPSSFGSALSYIPEEAWNESGAATDCPPNDTCKELWATSGGASYLYGKPSWQVAPGVPSDGARDVPDVSLTAASHDGYLVQISGNLYVIGGTSASSPSFAGLMALVVQKTGQRQGNANPRLYQLGAAQYGQGGAAAFHDTTLGNNAVPGVAGFLCGTGYDQATGLGSVNAATLVNVWGGCASISLAPSNLPGGTKGMSYSQAITASGGTGPYTYLVTGGALPAGLSLSSGGTLSGTPAAGGTFPFTVTATDANTCSGGQAYTLGVVVPPPVIGALQKLTPFGIKVSGSNLQNGLQVSINGAPWTDVKWKSAGKVKILGGKALKMVVPKGVQTSFLFVNPDGGQASATWSW